MMLTVTLSANKANNTIDSVKSTIQQVLPDSSQLTFKEVYSDVKAGLTGLASALKVGAEHIYEVLIKKQISDSITGTILFVISIILLFIATKYLRKLYAWDINRQKDDHYKDYFGIIMVTIIVYALGLTLLGFCLANLNSIVQGYVNPEYGAIKEILEFTK